MNKQLIALSLNDTSFPPVSGALDEPDGLLAVGGDLSPERLISAYQQAIFPWFSEGDPILWWSPSERAIINPAQVHISKSMAKFIRQTSLTITVNSAFSEVVNACALPRKTQAETWISPAIKAAYQELHQLGVAHSIEIWNDQDLVGGLYGVNIGGVFCGESMFHQQTNASKLAFIALCRHFAKHQGQLVDCQMVTTHLQSLGVTGNSRENFVKQLKQHAKKNINNSCWNKQKISL